MKPEVKQLIKTQAISTDQLNFDWPKTYMFILGGRNPGVTLNN